MILKKYKDFLKENNSFVEGLEYDLTLFKKAYRWVGQPGLFRYLYGNHPEMQHFVMDTGKETGELPTRVDIMETSFEGGIPMTVDPGYIGEPGNGETVIRLVFDLQLLIKDLGIEKFKNLLTNGEGEFRIMEEVKNWTKYLIEIDIDDEFYHNVTEDDFGDWMPMKGWIPSNIKTNIFTENPWDRNEPRFGPQISRNMLNKDTGPQYIKDLIKKGKI